MTFRIIFFDGKVDTFTGVVSIDCLPDVLVVYFRDVEEDEFHHFCFARCRIKRFYLY